MLIKIVVDGKEHETELGSADHLALQLKANAARDAAVAAATARADTAEARIKTLEADLVSVPARVASEIAARSALEAKAAKVLGSEAKFDGKSDNAIRVEVIRKFDASFADKDSNGKDWADEYLRARADSYFTQTAPKSPASLLAADLNRPVHTSRRGQVPANFDYDASVAKSRQDAADLWKRGLTAK